MVKNKEKEFINLEMGMFIKASIKLIKGKEKEFMNLQMGEWKYNILIEIE